MKTYEITLYNQDVRKALESGHSHTQYDDAWADQHFLQVEARDMAEARRRIQTRHPERQGFIIVDIIEIPDFQ
ncbi:MAG: hypothetical protein COB54_05595 [Alphaproteobacteria bacterium]|nr:MAG: hypothetical protein COB54_05595 [Alphaproteobacteria bacterium]